MLISNQQTPNLYRQANLQFQPVRHQKVEKTLSNRQRVIRTQGSVESMKPAAEEVPVTMNTRQQPRGDSGKKLRASVKSKAYEVAGQVTLPSKVTLQ